MADPLFEPLFVGPLELANRICMPAMHLNMTTDFTVTQRLLDFYAARAEGGAALIIVGYATVDGLSGNRTCLGAHDDKFLPGLARLAQTIQTGGARAAVQLNHAGRYNYGFLLGKKRPVAPSAVASKLTRETPRALELEEIVEVVEAFGRAAARTRQAGFDAVELLAGTGYLISQFLSPLTNQRTDDYGGSLANRMRFGVEVVQSVRRHAGADFPLLVRLNGNDFMPGGIGSADLRRFAKTLVDTGVDALNVNVGWHEARVPQIVASVPRGVFRYLVRGIKEQVSVPVIAGHRINDPDLARRLIERGCCDMVAMGRALIADPYLPEKARRGHGAAILHCVACGQGCLDNVFRLRPVQCLCNPRAGFEREREVQPAPEPRRIMVVGGGPAGLAAAAAAAERGHSVGLYEQAPRLGGQLLLAGRPPGREELLGLAQDLEQLLDRGRVEIHLGRTVDDKVLEAEAPDAVILATGAQPLRPDLPGVDLPHVVQAWDVLRAEASVGRRAVVLGGGSVGVETALLLAAEGSLSGEELKFLLVQGAEPPEELRRLALRGFREVTVLELRSKAGADLGKSTRWTVLQDLERFGVQLRTATTAESIVAEGVWVTRGGQRELIPADTVVLALGAASLRPLEEALLARKVEHRVVGDARRIGDVMQAIHEGFEAGSAL